MCTFFPFIVSSQIWLFLNNVLFHTIIENFDVDKMAHLTFIEGV